MDHQRFEKKSSSSEDANYVSANFDNEIKVR